MPWPGSRFSPGSALGRPIMGVRGEALQCVNRPFPGRDNGQQPARSRFNPPSRPGQRLRECGAGTMDWDQAVAVSLVHMWRAVDSEGEVLEIPSAMIMAATIMATEQTLN